MSPVTDPVDIFEEADPFELNDEMPIGILSPSSISTFQRCPEEFRRSYVLKEPKVSGAWAVSGTAFHEGRRRILELQRDQARSASDLELQVAYDRSWRAALKDGAIAWGKETPAQQRERGWQMLREYHRTLGASVIPTVIEGSAKGYVPGVPVPLFGRIDVATAEEVIDTKTGRQLTHKLKPEWYVQGVIYVYMTGLPIRWHSVSEKPAATTNDELVLAPTPRVLSLAERFTADAYEGIRDLLRSRGPNEHWPVLGPASGGCKYCSYKRTCPGVPSGD